MLRPPSISGEPKRRLSGLGGLRGDLRGFLENPKDDFRVPNSGSSINHEDLFIELPFIFEIACLKCLGSVGGLFGHTLGDVRGCFAVIFAVFWRDSGGKNGLNN